MNRAPYCHFAVFATMILPLFVGSAVHAQQTAAPIAQPPPAMAPFVDSVRALRGADLLRELRAGGYLLYMRHAFAGPPQPVCPGEAALTEEGQSQARQVGAALRALRVPVSRIEASRTCRTQDTARLLDLGPVTVNPDLDPASLRVPVADFGEQFKYLLRRPPEGGNWLMVSHVQGAPDPQDRILIGYAEIVVYRFEDGPRALPLARIPLQAWPRLISKAKAQPSN
ncbi:MAG: histidine phosphatase family protein [Burkholderiaceae bacterium]